MTSDSSLVFLWNTSSTTMHSTKYLSKTHNVQCTRGHTPDMNIIWCHLRCVRNEGICSLTTDTFTGTDFNSTNMLYMYSQWFLNTQVTPANPRITDCGVYLCGADRVNCHNNIHGNLNNNLQCISKRLGLPYFSVLQCPSAQNVNVCLTQSIHI